MALPGCQVHWQLLVEIRTNSFLFYFLLKYGPVHCVQLDVLATPLLAKKKKKKKKNKKKKNVYLVTNCTCSNYA